MVSLLKIKNMVCRHCIEALLDICKVLELEVKSITGMSVSQFEKVDDKFRKGINEV